MTTHIKRLLSGGVLNIFNYTRKQMPGQRYRNHRKVGSHGLGIYLAMFLTACIQLPQTNRPDTAQLLSEGEVEVNKCLVISMSSITHKSTYAEISEAGIKAADDCTSIAMMYVRVIRASYMDKAQADKLADEYKYDFNHKISEVQAVIRERARRLDAAYKEANFNPK